MINQGDSDVTRMLAECAFALHGSIDEPQTATAPFSVQTPALQQIDRFPIQLVSYPRFTVFHFNDFMITDWLADSLLMIFLIKTS
jgi:hypothetical protein